MSGVVKGRLLVNVSTSSDSDASNVAFYYRSVYDFLKVQVEPAGYITEIANGGSTGSNPGPGAFSVWRWNTHAGRTWPWYLLVQMTSGSTVPSSRLPVTIEGNVSTFRNVGFGAAVGIEHQTGSFSYFNPWNGTTGSLGSDSKGNPIWGLTASNPAKERHLCIFPRSNVSGSRVLGSAGTSTNWSEASDLMAVFDGFTGNHGNGLLLNMWADQDDFLVTVKSAINSDHGHVFIGTYNPIMALTGVIPAPLLGYRRRSNANDALFSAELDIVSDARGPVAASVFPFVNPITGSDWFKSTCGIAFMWPEPYNEITTNRQLGLVLGTTSSFVCDIPTIFIDRIENPFGMIGNFNSQLLKNIAAIGDGTFAWGTTNSGSIEQRMAFFPADDTQASRGSYAVIWSGSFQPGTGSGVFTTISGGFIF